jgi:hypothetical protein
VVLSLRLLDLRHLALVLGERVFSIYSAHHPDTRPSPNPAKEAYVVVTARPLGVLSWWGR